MRLDYALYGLAIVLFVLTAFNFMYFTETNSQILYSTLTGVVGLLFLAAGYLVKPKSTLTPPVSTSQPVAPEQNTKTEMQKKIESIPENQIPTSSTGHNAFSQIRGINQNRASQLQANGINTLADLAKASSEDLAEKLSISPKIVKMWIGSAKKLLK